MGSLAIWRRGWAFWISGFVSFFDLSSGASAGLRAVHDGLIDCLVMG